MMLFYDVMKGFGGLGMIVAGILLICLGVTICGHAFHDPDFNSRSM